MEMEKRIEMDVGKEMCGVIRGDEVNTCYLSYLKLWVNCL